MEETFWGITMLFNAEHPAKAPDQIVVKDSGNVRLVKPEHP